MTEIIGRGERTALKVFRRLYPDHLFQTQVRLNKLIGVEPNSRLDKATVDIVCTPHGRDMTTNQVKAAKKILIHIDDNHHTGERTGKIDFLIDYYTRAYGHQSLRIREHNCPQLFTDSNYLDDPTILTEIYNEIKAWRINFD